jgi:hypothetical protein
MHNHIIDANKFGNELGLQGSLEKYVRTIVVICLLLDAYMMCLLLKDEDGLLNVQLHEVMFWINLLKYIFI